MQILRKWDVIVDKNVRSRRDLNPQSSTPETDALSVVPRDHGSCFKKLLNNKILILILPNIAAILKYKNT